MASSDRGRASEKAESTGSGSDARTFGQCTDCRAVYLIHETTDGAYHPVGTDETCNCGIGEFVTPADGD